jgi:hypothetical protein
MSVIDGKAIANQIHIELAQAVTEIKETLGVTPGLAVILVGERKDSQSYVKSKKKACADIGMTSFGYDYPADVTEAELIKKIDELNAGISIIHCNDIHDYLITSLSSSSYIYNNNNNHHLDLHHRSSCSWYISPTTNPSSH